jgi:hypothetical protein
MRNSLEGNGKADVESLMYTIMSSFLALMQMVLKVYSGCACFYLPNPTKNMVMMNSFILNHVVPNVNVCSGAEQIDTAAHPKDNEQEINPIQKVAVTGVSRDHGTIFADTIGDAEDKDDRRVGHQQGTNVTVQNCLGQEILEFLRF